MFFWQKFMDFIEGTEDLVWSHGKKKELNELIANMRFSDEVLMTGIFANKENNGRAAIRLLKGSVFRKKVEAATISVRAVWCAVEGRRERVLHIYDGNSADGVSLDIWVLKTEGKDFVWDQAYEVVEVEGVMHKNLTLDAFRKEVNKLVPAAKVSRMFVSKKEDKVDVCVFQVRDLRTTGRAGATWLNVQVSYREIDGKQEKIAELFDDLSGEERPFDVWILKGTDAGTVKDERYEVVEIDGLYHKDLSMQSFRDQSLELEENGPSIVKRYLHSHIDADSRAGVRIFQNSVFQKNIVSDYISVEVSLVDVGAGIMQKIARIFDGTEVTGEPREIWVLKDDNGVLIRDLDLEVLYQDGKYTAQLSVEGFRRKAFELKPGEAPIVRKGFLSYIQDQGHRGSASIFKSNDFLRKVGNATTELTVVVDHIDIDGMPHKVADIHEEGTDQDGPGWRWLLKEKNGELEKDSELGLSETVPSSHVRSVKYTGEKPERRGGVGRKAGALTDFERSLVLIKKAAQEAGVTVPFFEESTKDLSNLSRPVQGMRMPKKVRTITEEQGIEPTAELGWRCIYTVSKGFGETVRSTVKHTRSKRVRSEEYVPRNKQITPEKAEKAFMEQLRYFDGAFKEQVLQAYAEFKKAPESVDAWLKFFLVFGPAKEEYQRRKYAAERTAVIRSKALGKFFDSSFEYDGSRKKKNAYTKARKYWTALMFNTWYETEDSEEQKSLKLGRTLKRFFDLLGDLDIGLLQKVVAESEKMYMPVKTAE